MPNPFSDPQIKILQEAFPDIDCSVIELAFWKAKGDMNIASEILLEPDSLDIYQHSSYLTNYGSNNYSRVRPPIPHNNTAKPPTVREELAQWRQELRRENYSERISNSSSNRSRSVFSLPSISGRFPYNPFGNDSFHSSCTPPSLPTSLRRPLVTPSPNISIRPIHPSINSGIHTTRSTPSIPSLAPNLPPRRPSHPSTERIPETNPFLNNNTSSPSVLRTTGPGQTIEENGSFNPFEEQEGPPPAYSEIQNDRVIYLNP